MLYVMMRTDYERFTGHACDPIVPGSVMVTASGGFDGDVIELFGTQYPVSDSMDFPDKEIQGFLGDKQVVYVVVEDERAMEPFLACEVQYHLEIDTDGTPEERKAFAGAVREALEAGRKKLHLHKG